MPKASTKWHSISLCHFVDAFGIAHSELLDFLFRLAQESKTCGVIVTYCVAERPTNRRLHERRILLESAIKVCCGLLHSPGIVFRESAIEQDIRGVVHG